MPEAPTSAQDAALKKRVLRYGVLLLFVAVALGIWGEVSRVLARSALGRQTAEAAVPTVVTVTPTRSNLGDSLVLPGTVTAFIEAPIYARTSGYLKAWYTDIGTRVVKGQLLAEIETPEIDQQLSQAQADLATARANEALAQSTNIRWKGLLATDSVSKQDAADSAAANVARLRELESFKHVLAPFNGVVTARNTDVGALINAGQSAGSELFHVAESDKLRIYVQVPEAYAAAIKTGVDAELSFTERPGKTYSARIVRTAEALDPNVRSLQVELALDNSTHEILPGAYTEVRFKLSTDRQTLRLPANTILFRSAGLQVATLDADRHVKLKSIVQGRDFGTVIEVLSGLEPNDVVVLNPPDSIVDGELMRIAPASAS